MIVQIGERNHRSLRTARRCAGKLRGDEFSFFRRAIENRARDRRANDGRVQLRLGIVDLALGLRQSPAGARNFFLPRSDLHQLKCFFQGVHSLLIGFKLGGRIVERLFGDHAAAPPVLWCDRASACH